MTKATKKLLLIGDLRTAYNYGAIATSETLLEMMHEVALPSKMCGIDYRSMVAETPVNGWPLDVDEAIIAKHSPSSRRLVRSGLRKLGVLGTVRKVATLLRGSPSQVNDKLPSRMDEYETYTNKFLAGEIFPYEAKLLSQNPIVVINGEGNIVNGVDQYGKYRRGARYLLFMAYVAKKCFGNYCAIINHTVDPKNEDAEEMIRKIYPMLDRISVREPLSIKELKRIGYSGEVHYSPDVLFSAKSCKNWVPPEALSRNIRFDEPYICLGDSSGLRSVASVVKWDVPSVYAAMIEKLRVLCPQIVLIDGFNGVHPGINQVAKRLHVPCLNLSNCPWRDLQEVLGRAQVFVSGRWHASILSVVGGTPVVLWGSDSHKTKALYTMYDFKARFYDVNTLPIHLDNMVNTVSEVLQERARISSDIAEKSADYAVKSSGNVTFLRDILR